MKTAVTLPCVAAVALDKGQGHRDLESKAAPATTSRRTLS
jgi:hypothetical protein